jgi:hypothetical protein
MGISRTDPPPPDTALRAGEGAFAGSTSLFLGYEPAVYEREGLGNEPVAGGEINYPWLIAMSAMMGNAGTLALWRNSQVFCEPEWGFDISGVGPGNYSGKGGNAAVGGMTIWW